jgi:hypothetical protein
MLTEAAQIKETVGAQLERHLFNPLAPELSFKI